MNQGVTRKCNPYFFGRGSEVRDAQSSGEWMRIFLRER